MKLVSINVSRPIPVPYEGETLMTGIFKKPVAGPVNVRRTNLDGDGQADLENHGGESKAVYAYSHDHYSWWQQELGREDMPFGQFGENLTIAGLLESKSFLGDRLRIGTAEFAISQPRVPCFKLGIRFGDRKIVKRFTKSLRTGYYLAVTKEGVVEAGDAVEVLQRGAGRIPIDALFEALILKDTPDADALLAQALSVPELADEWRTPIQERLRRSRGIA